MFRNFTEQAFEFGPYEVVTLQAGDGDPVLLLHGFPQTRAAWHLVAPRLAERFSVVVPDLPGYGSSTGPEPDADHRLYSKRAIGEILLRLMDTHRARSRSAGRGGAVRVRGRSAD